MMLRLYVIPHSPWSEKARWALDVQGVPYQLVPHVPVVGGPALRLRTRSKLRGPLTLPVALHNGQVLGDSYEIARFGSQRSTTPLVPAGHESEIARYNRLSEQLLAAGRVMATRRVAADAEAIREYVPAPVAKLRRVGPAIGRTGARRLLRKYAHVLPGHPPLVLRDGLLQLREALDEVPGDHLVGDTLTYADVAMAVVLQFVEPVSDRYVRLRPATRREWRDAELAEEFSDLVAWRDRIYAAFRDADPATRARVVGNGHAQV